MKKHWPARVVNTYKGKNKIENNGIQETTWKRPETNGAAIKQNQK